MDGLEELTDVVVLAATNRPELVDPALLRPGRFDRQILILPPDNKARLEIFKIHTKNMPLSGGISLKDLAAKTENFSGADIKSLCVEAAMLALRKDINAKKIEKKYFTEALKKVKPTLDAKESKKYRKALSEVREEALSYMG